MVRGRLARDGLIAFVLVRSLERGRDGKIGGDASQAFGNERTGRRASLRAHFEPFAYITDVMHQIAAG